MRITFGVSWEERKGPRLAVAAALSALLLVTLGGPGRAAQPLVSVIVRALPGSVAEAERAVEDAGGLVGRRLGIVDGFTADLPASSAARIAGLASVRSMSLDARLRAFGLLDGVTDVVGDLVDTVGDTTGDVLTSDAPSESSSSPPASATPYDPATDPTSLFSIANGATGAADYWKNGITGAGVDVALVDSGVAPVDGLTTPDKIVHGPDLSFEGQSEALRHLDTFGHGTHIASIIAGRDPGVVNPAGNPARFVGVAPGARLVSLKVADYDGAADVSQVIAAIDWVVQHRNTDGLNIRVLNLAFGTDGVQSYLLDPLAYAVEVAWHKGIVVVVAGGNSGGERTGLTNPAVDPYVIAVAASHDADGRYGSADTSIPAWSSRGDGVRNPDLAAPGRSIGGLRVPGSFIDVNYPGGRLGDRYFRGSGTSQATAVMAGAAALVLQQRPGLVPDQVKSILRGSAAPVPDTGSRARGSGTLDLRVARARSTPPLWRADQIHPTATGLGSLDGARGTHRVADGDLELRGEQDIFGVAWDGRSWSEAAWDGRSWSGDEWRGRSWSARAWTGRSWSGRSWSDYGWSENSWDGRSWSGRSWSGRSWSGRSWSGRSWSGRSWSASLWS